MKRERQRQRGSGSGGVVPGGRRASGSCGSELYEGEKWATV